MAKKKIDFMCTAFRDGFQSAYGARVQTPDFLPALEAARDAGISYFEAGGGARFQSLYFYCQEDAFDMMDAFRETAGPDANLQTLARGVNVVGLESQSSDIIKLHAEMFKKHGMTTIRNFDALNDVNNLIYSGQCIVDAGLKHQVVVTMMELPPGCTGAHDAAFYAKTLQDILDAQIPFDAVCFKDASGTAVPSKVYETIKQARKMLPSDAYIHFHTHETTGVSVLAYQAAIDAGADAIDLSLAPCSGGTCQPDVIVMWHALRGTDYTLDVDIEKIRGAEEVFKDCMKDYFLPPEAIAVEPLIPWSPMPGGALTANTQMLRDNGIMDRYPEMIKAMSDVVRRGGYGTSVTPVSQFYFQQAFNNVMFGPWEKIAEPYGKMVLGYFGKTPVPPDPEIVALASKQLELEPTTRSPIEMNDEDPTKGVAPARKTLEDNNLPTTDENIFIVAACKDKGLAFLQGKAQLGIRKIEPETPAAASAPASSELHLKVDGKAHTVRVDGGTVTVNGRAYQVEEASANEVSAAAAASEPAPAPKPAAPTPQPAAAPAANATPVKAQMPGVVLKTLVNVGDKVTHGQALMTLEAMKMEMPVPSPCDGVVAEINITQGEHVSNGQQLASIG
ncbi:2-oxoglutarate carboxylase large subunit [Posidoniimonas polymericola]|uniref:2-oxoglutarate carboxylase large subunit n=1 Tax=Posidoniimonas polymericola TaxID=2528002 RepID=A0A5C5YRB1_9BACT|nr:biotin/lipoyl-containing protein [Posidoniimonas polymericola]TWT77482.1 2-oxoglutarate carboxylase large subunit [Posidoniimonas polymericola]